MSKAVSRPSLAKPRWTKESEEASHRFPSKHELQNVLLHEEKRSLVLNPILLSKLLFEARSQAMNQETIWKQTHG